MSYDMQKAKNKLSKNEVFGHFLEFGLLDGLSLMMVVLKMAMVRGHANNKVKAKE